MTFQQTYALWFGALIQVTHDLDILTPAPTNWRTYTHNPGFLPEFTIACVYDYARLRAEEREKKLF